MVNIVDHNDATRNECFFHASPCVCCNSTSVEIMNESGAFFFLHTGKKSFSTLSLNNSTGVEKTPEFSSVFGGENTSFLVQSGGHI